MTAKRMWGLAIAGLVGLISLVGAPIADSLVKEGKLPDWLSLKLAGLLEFLTRDVQVDFWVMMLFVILFFGLAIVGWSMGGRSTSEQEEYIARLKAMCEEHEQRYVQMEAHKNQLMEQLAEKSQATKEIEFELPPLASSVLVAVAMFTDSEITPTLTKISTSMNIGSVKAHAAIDILVEHGLLDKFVDTRGVSLKFTPKGRAYYLTIKEA